MSNKNARLRLSRYVLIWVAACLLICGGGASSLAAERRLITIADVIEMTRLADEGYFRGGAPDQPVGLFSPDGSRFVVAVRKGNITRNTNEYSLLLFRSSEAIHKPVPEFLVTMSSSSNRYGIANVRWLADNRTIVFLGENPREIPAIYSIDIDTRRLRKLTDHPTPIVAYDISSDGREIVYEAAPQPKKFLNTDETRKNGIVVSSQYPSELLTNDYGVEGAVIGSLELFVQPEGGKAVALSPNSYLMRYLPLWLSPDGRYAVVVAQVNDIPERWSEYSEPLLHSYVAGRREHNRLAGVHQLMLVDVRQHSVEPLLDAPLGWSNRNLAWSPRGDSVVVSGTYLPLDGNVPAQALQTRRSSTSVVEVHLPDRKITEISTDNLAVQGWEPREDEVTLGPEAPNGGALQTYCRTSSGWQKCNRASTPVAEGALQVTLEEDINTAPRLYVRSANDQQKTLLMDLNPQLAGFKLGKVEAVTWKASDGHEVRGGLYLPPDYRPGQRYPLVIQTHGFDPSRFWIDGPWTSAFAAQPLAAKDIVVLQVGESVRPTEDRKFRNTPEEAARQMAAYEGAIDDLDRRGLIDRNKVGIIGFSRTVYHVEYTLTHSRYPFAAAVIADGFDGGYLNYLFWGVAGFTDVNGGAPVGPSMSSWLERSPGFSVDHVQAPVRMEYYGFAGVLSAWQWYAGLSLLHKPVDFVWIPDGTHMLHKPWDRLISQQGSVDWFAFWLKGETSPDPAKADQYRRWSELRLRKSPPQNEQSEPVTH